MHNFTFCATFKILSNKHTQLHRNLSFNFFTTFFTKYSNKSLKKSNTTSITTPCFNGHFPDEPFSWYTIVVFFFLLQHSHRDK